MTNEDNEEISYLCTILEDLKMRFETHDAGRPLSTCMTYALNILNKKQQQKSEKHVFIY